MTISLREIINNYLGDKTTLTTTAKGTLVAAVNELDADVGDKTTLTTTAKGTLVAAVNELDADVGDKSTLTTTAKGSLVAAVNELDADVGDKSTLKTTAKSSLVAAVNELAALKTETSIAPTLLNSWVNYDATNNKSAGYFKSQGLVRLEGMIKTGTIAAGTIIATLPAGYRPLKIIYLATACSAGSAVLSVDASGNIKTVTVGANVWLTLEGLSFKAEQ